MSTVVSISWGKKILFRSICNHIGEGGHLASRESSIVGEEAGHLTTCWTGMHSKLWEWS